MWSSAPSFRPFNSHKVHRIISDVLQTFSSVSTLIQVIVVINGKLKPDANPWCQNILISNGNKESKGVTNSMEMRFLFYTSNTYFD